MTHSLNYNASAAHSFLDAGRLKDVEPKLLAARDELFGDVELLRSGRPVADDKQPLDAGFINLPAELLDEHRRQPATSLLGKIEKTAAALRKQIDRIVILGIGGSYMGARALFEALLHPYHNELTPEERNGAPRFYFEGNNLDNDALVGLLELLKKREGASAPATQRWGVVVISKSGGTLETAASFRLFQKAFDEFYGVDSEESGRLIVPVTGDQGKLRELSAAKGYKNVFPIPDNVGGRFSIFTAVGLFPSALLGLDVEALLRGAAEMTERFLQQPPGNNPVLDYTATCHLLEADRQMTVRVLSTWGSRLEAVGLWYDQLLSESLGKHERGATPITVVNTRDLHSRGQQHQEGTRDKLITNVIVGSTSRDAISVPTSDHNQDDLNRLAGKTFPELLSAALEGTNRAYAGASRPTADILMPTLDAFTLGQLFQMFMLATVLEGRLIGINPYGQPGVEAYKNNMQEILDR